MKRIGEYVIEGGGGSPRYSLTGNGDLIRLYRVATRRQLDAHRNRKSPELIDNHQNQPYSFIMIGTHPILDASVGQTHDWTSIILEILPSRTYLVADSALQVITYSSTKVVTATSLFEQAFRERRKMVLMLENSCSNVWRYICIRYDNHFLVSSGPESSS